MGRYSEEIRTILAGSNIIYDRGTTLIESNQREFLWSGLAIDKAKSGIMWYPLRPCSLPPIKPPSTTPRGS